MKKLISLVLCVTLILSFAALSACGEEKESYKEIFEKDKIIDVKINIDEADLEDIRENPRNEEYHAADITVDGVTVEDAGIRTKGNMTLNSVASSDSERYSYRIKFNKYVKGNKLLGLDELCLNSGYSDPSYMREYLHCEILRELGMNVPETAFCRVYINDEYAGFYLAVEGLDSTFLKDNFGDDYKDGNFYKMDEGASLQYKEDENYIYADLKSGSDDDLSSFKEFVKALNDAESAEDIEKILNVDSAIKYIASNTVLCNYDSYNGNMHHNYYLYEDKDGVFTVVPWDFNMSFGGFGGNNYEVGIDTPITSGSVDELPLISKLLSIPEYKEKYYDCIKEITGLLENFEERVTELKSIISPYVKEDTTAFYSYDEFDKATSKGGETDSSASEDKRGGKLFGGDSSIIDCVFDRLENIAAQFDGTAEKTTETKGGFGGRGDKGNRPGGGMQPPENNSENNGFPNGGFGGFKPNRGENGGNMPGNGVQPPELPNGANDGNNQPPELPNSVNDGNNQTPELPNGANNENNQNRPTPPNGGFGGKSENKDIRVHVNGHIISFDNKPYISNDSTLVGFRKIFEALGAKVSWDEETRTVTATKDDVEIKLTIGDTTAYANGEKVELAAAPEISSDTAMIPVRFISEELGMKVTWDADTKLITINSK